MSLTSQLRKPKSPIGRFFRETFPNTRGVLADFKDALSKPRIACLGTDASPAAYGQVGRAIDYRIRFHFAPTRSPDLVPDDWVDDVAALARAFAEQYVGWRGADATLNPTFAGSADVGGADADFIADGCLWEIKTERRPGRSWLDQLLGYTLLDYEDTYAIDRVGVLLPRLTAHVTWPIRELIARLSGNDGLELPELRRRFRLIAEDPGDKRRAAIVEAFRAAKR